MILSSFPARAGCLLATAVLFGCGATIGTPNPDLLGRMAAEGAFGAWQSVRICALLDEGITAAAARKLVDEGWNDTEAAALGLRMRVVSARPWKSGGNDIEAVFRRIRENPVPPGCDRVLAFLGHSDRREHRQAGAVLLVHGFVLAAEESLRHFLMTPTEAVRHELYHLVGCGHAQVMDECYRRIAAAKGRRKGADAFLPVFLYIENDAIERNCGRNALIDDRNEANRIAGIWVSHTVLRAADRARPARPCPS